MFELNDQELGHVAGGLTINTSSGSSGGASSKSGTASTFSFATSKSGPNEISTSSGNTSLATGNLTTVISTSDAGITAVK